MKLLLGLLFLTVAASAQRCPVGYTYNAPTGNCLANGSTGGSTALSDTGHILADFKLHDITSCANGATVTDSSGNGNHGTVTSSGALKCDGPGFYGFIANTDFITLPSGATATMQGIELIYDPTSAAYSNGGIQSSIDSANPIVGAPNTPTFALGGYVVSADANWTFAATTMTDRFTSGHGFLTVPFGPHVISYDLYGNNWLDGKQDLRSGLGDIHATAKTGPYFIGQNGNTPAKGKIIRLIIRSTALTSQMVNVDMPIMLAAANAAGAALPREPQYPDFTKYDVATVFGDSICTGNGGPRPWHQLPAGMVSSNGSTSGTIVDPGSQGFMPAPVACISGSQIDFTAGALQIKDTLAPFKPRYGSLFAYIAGGTNNLSNGAVTLGYQIWDDFVPMMLEQIRSAGAVPIVGTLLDRAATLETVRGGYNARVRQECGIWDLEKAPPRCGILDFAAHPNVGWDGQSGNGTWFSDTVHPTQAGHNAMAILFANRQNMYWGTTRNNQSTTLTTGTTAQAYSDTYVPLNPAGGVTATTTLPDATGITNTVRRVACLSTAAGTCAINTTSSQTIISASGAVTSFNLAAGATAVLLADYASLQHPVNAAPGWVRMADELSSSWIPTTVFVSADFTTAANTNLQNVTGLTWTVPASTALNIGFSCHLLYSQGTATAAVSFGIQDVTVAPTQINAKGQIYTNTTVMTAGNLTALASTTATAIVTATPSAITTIWSADLDGFIEAPSNASASAINIMVNTATSGDAVTVKRGSFCRIN